MVDTTLTMQLSHVTKLGESASILLSYINDLDNGDWFALSDEDVLKHLGMSSFRVRKYLTILRKNKYIQIERRGISGKRWVKLLK